MHSLIHAAAPRRHRGFTLVEMAVVLLVLTLLAGGLTVGLSAHLARRAEAADVTIHNDGTYTVRPNQKGHNGKPAHGQSRAAAPTGRAPSPGARFAPHSAPARKPKNDQQKENTTWKTGKKKK